MKQFAYKLPNGTRVHFDCGGTFVKLSAHSCCGLVPYCSKCDLSLSDPSLVICDDEAEARKLKELDDED